VRELAIDAISFARSRPGQMTTVRVCVVLHGRLAGLEAVESGESVEIIYYVEGGAPFDDLARQLQEGGAGDIFFVTKVRVLVLTLLSVQIIEKHTRNDTRAHSHTHTHKHLHSLTNINEFP
jgi:hypothetical protein